MTRTIKRSLQSDILSHWHSFSEAMPDREDEGYVVVAFHNGYTAVVTVQWLYQRIDSDAGYINELKYWVYRPA